MDDTILIDTHLLLWARTAPEKLTTGERRLIQSSRVRMVSTVSLWEFAILIGLSRIERNEDLLTVPVGYEFLPIRPDHCKALSRLPQHHRDPFDRMLIAQAQSEAVPLLTRDRTMMQYHEHATVLRLPDA
jgi:PIN domain nuclease of toxin-antitoxin system